MSISAAPATAPKSDLVAMLELMSSPKALKDKMAELAEKQKAADEAVALVGPAQQIPALAEAAKKDRATAAEELASVRSQAQGMIDVARATAEGLLRDAQIKAEGITSAALARTETAKAQEAATLKAASELNELSQKHDKRERAVSAREQEVSKARDELAKDKAEHAHRMEVLKGVREALIAQHNEHLKALSV